MAAEQKVVKIIHLPTLVLARIIAYACTRKYCKYADFSWQLSCDTLVWKELQPFFSTCRAFREACKQAIAGLIPASFMSPYQVRRCGYGYLTTIPIESALSLPCLREVRVYEMPGETLNQYFIENVETLKCLHLSGSYITVEKLCNVRTFPAASKLEELGFHWRSRETTNRFLSFPYDNLKTLHFYGPGFIPSLPPSILRTLENFWWVGDFQSDPKPLYQALASAPRLKMMYLHRCSIAELNSLNRNDKFRSLKALTLDTRGLVVKLLQGCASSLDRAVSKNRFPILRELTLIVRLKETLQVFEAPLVALAITSLRKVIFWSFHFPTDSDVRSLNYLAYRGNIEIEIVTDNENEKQMYSAKRILGIEKLKSIHIRHTTIRHIDQLARMVDLRKVYFEACVCDKSEAISLMEDRSNLEVIVFKHCVSKGRKHNIEYNWDPSTTEFY